MTTVAGILAGMGINLLINDSDQSDRVIICGTCAEGRGAAFAEELRNHIPDRVAVQVVECLNVCDKPVAMALRGPGKDVYLFSGVLPETDLDDTVALARLYSAAEGGAITDARPAGRLRLCLLGRVPR